MRRPARGDVKPSWLPLRCGLVLVCVGGAVRHGGPVVREALRRNHWFPYGRAMAWSRDLTSLPPDVKTHRYQQGAQG